MRTRVVGGALSVLATALLLSAVTTAIAQPDTDGAEGSPSAVPAVLEQDVLQAILDQLPDPVGNDDSEQIRSLLGLPDAFTITFEPQADESISRREQWFYFDLSTVFEFVDGRILWNLPLDAETAVLLTASRHDPTLFEETSTWRSLAPALSNPFSFEKVLLDEEYGVPATIYAGDQLVLAFDEDGALFYVETVPLAVAETP